MSVGDDFSYRVDIGGERWLVSAPIRAHVEHTEHPAPVRVGNIRTGSGVDEVGNFTSTIQNWRAGATMFSTSINTYNAHNVVVFETNFPDGAGGTNASEPVVPGGWPGSQGNVKPIVGFPAFDTTATAAGNGTTPGLASLDQLRWEDNFCYFSHGPGACRLFFMPCLVSLNIVQRSCSTATKASPCSGKVYTGGQSCCTTGRT